MKTFGLDKYTKLIYKAGIKGNYITTHILTMSKSLDYTGMYGKQLSVHKPPKTLFCRYSFIPESFRWYVTRNKRTEARATVDRVARWNRRTVSDYTFMRMYKAVAKLNSEENENYSVFVLFTKRALLRLTIPMIICWYVHNSFFCPYLFSLESCLEQIYPCLIILQMPNNGIYLILSCCRVDR